MKQQLISTINCLPSNDLSKPRTGCISLQDRLVGLPGSLKWHSSVIFQPISMKLALLFREHYGLWRRAYKKIIKTRQHVLFFSLELANSSLKIALLTLASRCKKVIHVEFKLKIMIYISNIHVYLHLKLCFI